MRSVAFEPNFAGWVDSRQSPRLLPLSGIRSETGGLRSTSVTQLHHYYTPIRHPHGRFPSLTGSPLPGSQPDTNADFPCCTFDHYPACCHHYPGGIIGCISRSLPRRHRPSSLLWRVGFHNDISRPAQCSLTLRPAEPVGLLRDRFKKCFSPFVTSWTAPCTSGRSESWPGRICTDESNVPLQGTHNNPVENTIRPIAIGKKNWLFAGSERAGRRAAAIQTLIGTAKLNGLDPHAWLKDTLEKLPVWPNNRLDELLPLRPKA